MFEVTSEDLHKLKEMFCLFDLRIKEAHERLSSSGKELDKEYRKKKELENN